MLFFRELCPKATYIARCIQTLGNVNQTQKE